MEFPTPLVPGTLVRRYKRFLADIVLESGQEVTAHCPNPGSMMGLAVPGVRVWLQPNNDPRKKLKYGWRLVEMPDGHFAGIDAGAANRIVHEALLAGQIAALTGYGSVRPEVRYGDKSRIDFLLSGPERTDTYVEVKSVTLRRSGTVAEFPDSVTARGTRHLADLAQMVREGHRAVMLFLVQRTDCDRFDVAGDIDGAYAAAFRKAAAAGVEMICHSATISTAGIALADRIAVTGVDSAD